MEFLPISTRSHDSLSAQPPVVWADAPEFLIEASSAYPKLEKLTLDARESLWFAFRIFDPDTPLYHPETRALGLETWADLIAYKLDRGIHFRLLLTDFDPVVGDGLHEDTWRAVVTFYDRMKASDKTWDMQICPALHEARTGRYLRMLLAPAVYSRVNSKRHELNDMPSAERADTFEFLRGYHRYLRLTASGQVQWRPKLVLPRIYPVTHHHKLAIFDNETVTLGGLDVNERRYDDPGHGRASVDTWHDMSVCVTGAPATHAAQYVAGIWNMDYKAANQRMILARAQCPRLFGSLVTPLDRLVPPALDTADTGEVPMQIVRTVSRNCGRIGFRMRPETVDHGLEDAHLGLVRHARTLLYIETQFFRHKALAEALVARAEECPELRLVMLLPAAPEEIAFDDKNGLDSRYGERLQADCIAMVKEAFGNRALFVCPALRERKTGDGRDVVNDAAIIYVHAKVAVADDEWAVVGSANLNGRSLKWDSEIGLLWHGESAGDLRRRLATDWIDADAAALTMAESYDEWYRVAATNASRPVHERRGFILPYLPDKADAMGLAVPMMPPELV